MTTDLELEHRLNGLAHGVEVRDLSASEVRRSLRRRRQRRTAAMGGAVGLGAAVVGLVTVNAQHDSPERSGAATPALVAPASSPSETQDTVYEPGAYPYPRTAGGKLDPATVPAIAYPDDFPAEIPKPDTYVDDVRHMYSDNEIVGWQMLDLSGKSGGASACRRYAAQFDSWPSREALDEIDVVYARVFTSTSWTISILCTNAGEFNASVMKR